MNFQNISSNLLRKAKQVIKDLDKPVAPDSAHIVRLTKQEMQVALNVLLDHASGKEADAIVLIRDRLDDLVDDSNIITNAKD